MSKRQYEITVKVGPSVIEHPNGQQGAAWDSIKTYYRIGLDAARTKRDEEHRKNRDAFISIRDAETLVQAG